MNTNSNAFSFFSSSIQLHLI